MDFLNELNGKYSISNNQLEFYKENKFIKIKNIFSPELIQYYNSRITKVVDRLSKESVPLEDRDTYGKAFLQLFNLWTIDDEVKNFIFSKK